MQFTDHPEVSVALVYQSQALHQHLRLALDECGARVVYETATSGFDRAALEQSGASVVLINLDPAIDEEIEHIEELLVDDARKVIFNDGEVTSKLSGWDLARWARHLASKVMGDTQLLPARPAGAEAVPVREMPQHGLDSTVKPAALRAPVVSSEAEDLASREIGAALDSFRAAESLSAERPRNEIEAALMDFGFFAGSETPESVNALAERTATSEASSSVQETSAPAPTRAADTSFFAGFDDAASTPDSAPDVAATAGPAQSSKAAPTSDADALFADFSFDQTISLDSAQDNDSNGSADDLAFAEISLDFDAPTETPADTDAVFGLDDFLTQHSYKEPEVTVELPVPPIPAKAKAPINVDHLLSNLSLELSPMEEPEPANQPTGGTAATAPAPAASAAKATTANLASDFDDILSSLSLQPMQLDEPEQPPVAAPAAAAAPQPQATAPAEANPFGDLQFGLEPMESESTDAAVSESNPFADLDFSADAIPGGALSGARTDTARSPAASAADLSDSALQRVWVLGASIGGPDAVREFLSGIPNNTGNLFLLAQHMGADFMDLMVGQLAKATALQVQMASNGITARHGQVLVVPLAERLLLGADGEVHVVPLDEASPYSPSIDQVLFDVADRFGARAGAIIFSGMAHDAIEGAKYLAAKGGVVWAQDPSTCVVSSMIDGAVEAGVVGFQGSPSMLAQKFVSEFR